MSDNFILRYLNASRANEQKNMIPKLSIIILNWNSKIDLEKCLASICENTALKEREIIVVDNCSRDGSVEFIKENYHDIVLIENKENRGVGPARNQGMKIAKGEFILILDVDTEIKPCAIDNLVKTMERNAVVGLSGAKLIYPDGKLQYSCREFPSVLSKFIFRRLPFKFFSEFLRKEEYRDWDHKSLKYVGYVIGACQLIRRKAMKDIGFYDDRIFYGPEDMDYCLRMWQKGWKVLYDPGAVIMHRETRITKGFLSQIKNIIFWRHIEGLIIYFLKHRYLFNPPKVNKK